MIKFLFYYFSFCNRVHLKFSFLKINNPNKNKLIKYFNEKIKYKLMNFFNIRTMHKLNE
jgi:hypothetical protein